MTTADLVRGLQARDRDAWQALYATYQPRLHRFACSLTGSAHDADDLVSETFVRVLPALDRHDPDDVDLDAYLFATTKNLYLKQVERTRRFQPAADVPEPDLPVAIDDDPERSALLAAQQREVRIANGRLEPRQRLVLALCELEERSYAEIGELVGLNENAVAQLVFRARQSLRTELRLLQVDPERLPEECRSFLPALSRHLDGQLTEPRRGRTLSHLEGCERCQAALTDMREARRRYRALGFPLLGAPGEEARAAVERSLDEAGWHVDRVGATPATTAAAVAAGTRAGRRHARRVVAAAVAAGLAAGGIGLAVALDDPRPPVTAIEAVSSEPPTELDPTSGSSAVAPAVAGSAPPWLTETSPAGAVEPAERTTTPATVAPARSEEAAPAEEDAWVPPTEAQEAPGPDTPETVAPSPPAPTSDDTPAPPVAPRDTTAPTVTLDRAPSGETSSDTEEVRFRASEQGATFACRLDDGTWSPCTSPWALTGLAPGPHALAVRAADAAGNTGSPVGATWTYRPPDTTAPTVTLTDTPGDPTTATTATVAFEASESPVTFACSVDGGPFAPCSSPASVQGLAPGAHALAVRATDAAGNVGPAAVARWTVLDPRPDLVVATLGSASVTVQNAGSGPAGPFVVVVALTTGRTLATFTVASLEPGQALTRTWPCAAGTVRATVDAAAQIAETDETNNRGTRIASCLGFGS